MYIVVRTCGLQISYSEQYKLTILLASKCFHVKGFSSQWSCCLKESFFVIIYSLFYLFINDFPFTFSEINWRWYVTVSQYNIYINRNQYKEREGKIMRAIKKPRLLYLARRGGDRTYRFCILVSSTCCHRQTKPSK